MRIILLVLVIAVVLFIVAQIVRTRHFIKVGENLVTETTPFAKSNSQAETRILMVGDSTAFGVGASSPEHSLAGLVAVKYPTAEIINVGVSGAKTGDALTQLEGIEDGSFDLVMLHIGGNDVVRFTSYKEFTNDLQELVALAERKGTHVLLTSTGNVGTVPLFPAGTRWIFGQRSQKVREIMMSLVAEKDPTTVRYTDLFRDRAIDPFALEPKKYYAADFFHPSDAGYADWFTFISAELDVFSL